MKHRRALLIGLSVATGLLSAALAYTYRVYTLAESNRRQQSEQLDRTVDALERAHRARLRERAEHRRAEAATRHMHRTLAAAYRHGAAQFLRERRHLAARVFGAAALLHDPANPLSPFRGRGERPGRAAPLADEDRAGLTQVQSVLYDAAVRGVITHRRTLGGLGFRVWSVAFSPDGKLLAVCGDSRKVRLWDVGGKRWAGDLVAPAMPVFEVAFSPDGKVLAAATNAGKIRLWDVARRKALRTMDAHGSMALSVRFSPDGRLLASGGLDSTVRLWDPASGAPRAVFRLAQGAVWSVAFSPDGRLLASAAWHAAESRIRLWSLKDRRPFANYTGPLGPVWTVAFSPDGEHLVSGGLDRAIRVFSTRKLRLLATLRHHRADVTSLAFSPDGRWLASTSIDRTLALWCTKRWKVVTRVTAHGRQLWSVAFSRKAGLLATGAWDETARLWRLEGGSHRPTWLGGGPPAPRRPFVAVWYTADGKRLIARDDANVFHVWEAETGKLVARRLLLPADLRRVAVSRDGRHVVASAPNDTVWVWTLESTERPRVLRGATGTTTDVAFSPDGTLVADVSRAGTLRLWRWADRKELDRVEKVGAPLAFSPDGALLAMSDDKRRVRLLRVKNLDPLRTLPGGPASVDQLRFGPRGETLLAVQDDQTMTLWSPRTGQKLRSLRGHADEIVDAAFSADGRYVVSTSRDRTVRIWETRTGQALQRLAVDQAALRVSFSPDGKHFAVPTARGVARYPLRLQLWRRDPARLLREAESAAGLRLDGFELKAAP